MAKDNRILPGKAEVASCRFIVDGDPDAPPERTLEGLTHVADYSVSDWLVASLTTFGKSVASIVPAQFEAYARVYHPIRGYRPTPEGEYVEFSVTWRDAAARAGVELSDLTLLDEIEERGSLLDAQARYANIEPDILAALLEHLGPATTTPSECYFALWEGFAGTIPFEKYEPSLWLPARAYHVFRGDLSRALVSFQQYFGDQSASLWWPADHAWCVASEVDFQWSYIGGPRSCIDAILRDARFESHEIVDVTAPFRR